MDIRFFNFAGFTIAIRFEETLYPAFEKDFKENILAAYQGFAIEKPTKKPHFTIDVTTRENVETIVRKKEGKYFVNYYEEKNKSKGITYYFISRLQFELIIRKVMHNLLESNDGFLLHASGSVIDNKAYLFLADAGGGKSTIARLLLNHYTRLSDDTVVIRKQNSKFYVHRTPLREKRPQSEKMPGMFPLGKIFFIHKNPELQIEKLEDKEIILSKFLKQGFFLQKEGMRNKIYWAFDFVKQWSEFYDLSYGLQNFNRVIELLQRI